MNKNLFVVLFWILSVPLFALVPNDSIAENQKLQIIRFEKVPSNALINSVYIDKGNRVWVGTNLGLYRISNVNDAPQIFLQGQNIKDVVLDPKGKIYVATENMLYMPDENIELQLPIDNARIHDLEWVEKTLWIATDKGMFTFQPNNSKFTHFHSENSSLRTNHINFIHHDRNGVTWLGTDKGEYRIKKDKWKSYNENNNVVARYENKEGLWFLSPDDMWLVDHFNRYYKVGLDANMYNGRVNDFAIDSKGRLYVASDKLTRYDPYQEKIESFEGDAAILSSKCKRIAADLNDNIWIGTDGAGLYRLAFKDLVAEQFTAALLQERAISCHGEKDATLRLNVSGGKGPYKYEWDARGISGASPRNLGPGEYSVTVTDQIQNRYVTSLIIMEPQAISIQATNIQRVSAPNTRDGAIEINAEGGTGNLSYLWSNGDRKSEATRLTAGSYTVTVSDENKCTAVASFDVPKEKFIPDLDIAKIDVGTKLRMNELYFKADSSEVTNESYEVLEEVLDFLRNHPNVVIEVGGHTNTVPPHEYCDRLSTERAKNVAEFFYDNDIPDDRVKYVGYGKRQPLTMSEALQGRRLNQRVEIKILSK
jgi:outer membrane protein OmpA-like peptidoglycan-associated protein